MSAVCDEQQRIEAALACIPPDVPREEWWRIAAALKHELGDAGFDVFDAWSQGGSSYDATAARDTWRSLDAGGGIAIGTLFHLAEQHGFDTRAYRLLPPDPANLIRRRATRQARDADEAQKRELERSHAASLALTLRAKSEPARDDHPYLMRKGLPAPPTLREIDAHKLARLLGYVPKCKGEPLHGRVLLAEIHIGSALTSVEMIDEAGRKSALAGGTKSGGWWAVAPVSASVDRLLIAEGVATALSAHVATGIAAVAALSCGNLKKVSMAMRQQHPNAEIVVLADLGNGEQDAERAALAVGGALARPDFGDDRPENASDFNDLHVLRGVDVVRACINAAVAAPAEPNVQTSEGAFPGLDERPCWRVYDGSFKIGDRRVKPGVYLHGVKPGKGDAPPELIDKWICSPMKVQAVTRNGEDAEYGRLLEILSPAGRWKKWAMPMSMLAGDGSDARAVLLSEGLVYDLNDRNAVLRYIAGQHPKESMRAAGVTGWHDDAFVLPDAAIGADDIWFQASGRVAPYATAGTFDGWRELAGLATGNPLLMLAISAAMAGPLLGPLNIDGGGVHLYGDSSCGKTTALLAGTSVWGGAPFKRTWRATANGLEGAGSLHSDTLLALDELGEIDPRNLYEAAYSLINGIGKTRANRHGEVRQPARWRVFLLSTGELTIAARMSAGGIEAKTGQELRILDIPVTGTYGLFETLHNRASGGLLSDDVRNLAAKHYGHAGPRFVGALVRELRAGFRPADALQPLVEKFNAAEGQERRAARTFAVCALAGEMAAAWDIVPWASDEPARAAIHAFNLWRSRRPAGGQNAEHGAILRAVSDFIDRHGDSRFSSIEGSADIVRDRAGWWKPDGDRRRYLFTPGGLRDAVKGYDISRALKALDDAGAIADRDYGEKSKKTHVPDLGEKKRLYHIAPEKIDGGNA